MPIGAIAGGREVMSVFDAGSRRPLLPQGGTFSANPLSMVAGLATMRHLDRAALARLEAFGDRLRAALRQSIAKHGAPFSVTGIASLFRIHPKPHVPNEFRDTVTTPGQSAALRELARACAAAGIILPTAAAACLSTPMEMADIDHVAETFDRFLAERGDVIEGMKA